MTTIQFLAEWALRSSILILSGALLLWTLRVKDPSIRLAAWTVVLFASLGMPLFTAVAPSVRIPAMHATPQPVEVPVVNDAAAPEPVREIPPQETHVSKPFDWVRTVATMYVLVAGALLLRLCFGLTMSRRLLRRSRATGQATEGIEIRESDHVASPVALGIARPAIMLPTDWRQWDSVKLDAVLAHERSHIRRHDPAVQLLSAIHRALLWHSPLSWLLHRRIVRVAEEASDDAAVAATRDRATYAEVLLEFMQRGVRGADWQGVAMARYSQPEERIHRILDGTAFSGGLTRWTVAAILALGSPLAYLVAAAQTAPAPRQTQAERPAFEVADIQLNKSGALDNDVSLLPGGRVSVRNATLKTLIIVAYNVRGNAVSRGPAWLDSDRFDIVAKANPKSSEHDLRLMMQTLLAERFKLKVHADQKVLPVYALTAGKQGTELTAATAPVPGQERCGPVTGADGNHHWVCDHVTMEEFAVALPAMAPGYLDRPVVDRTGLTGTYKFKLDWLGALKIAAGENGPTLFEALERQLGLEMVAQKLPIPIVVVDRIERTPTDN